jgi:hypothetical protein
MKIQLRIWPWACLMAMIAFGSCKYEEGPGISLRSKEERLVGWKKILLYLVDGVDSLPTIEAAFSNSSYDSTGFKWLYEIDGSQIICHRGCINGYWEFGEEDQEIFLNLPAPLFTGDVFPAGTWTILRFSHDDLWLTISANNKEYLLKLVRIE